MRTVSGILSALKQGVVDRLWTHRSTVRDGAVVHRAVHRAGRPTEFRRHLMTGLLTFTGLVGAATFAMSVMATPTPPGDSATLSRGTGGSDLLLARPMGAPGTEALNNTWDSASLGMDSASNSDLLVDPYQVEIEISAGDTLMSVLTQAGIERGTAHALITSLATVFDPRGLRPQQRLELSVVPERPTEPASVTEMRFHPDNLRDVVVSLTDAGDYVAEEDKRVLSDHLVRSEGTIDSSLYVAARNAGVPMPVLGSLINIFSFDVDFQREIQQGDGFALMFEEKRTEAGLTVDFGDILVAEMTVGGEKKRFFRFTDDDGFEDYYDAKGQSVRRALLRTPVEGARISSGFGKRTHPILGYTKVHKGLDFAAPTGTPIFAAGDGVVEVAGRNGSFGNYIRIRHNGTYKTAYAHLSRIDSRVKPGTKVRQRQIIGYVGTTGRSTGPHLHYEVHVNGKQTNPLGVKLPTGKTLKGGELARFERQRAEIETQYAAIEPSTQVAQAD